jgi:uncharacterized Zn finger protein
VSNWFPRSGPPLPVEGGLKARAARGPIAQTWWSRRFVAVLEEIGLGGRMQRGRSYARKGQVISLDVAAGLVTAEVQGSRADPYQVSIDITAFGPPEWAALERELAASAWYSAALLSGEMPEDIEQVFAASGLSLFPASARELSMHCSCPDFEVPCKHLAAVFYLLAESFDDDPFRILAWRGREREELLANLETARGAAAAPAGAAALAGSAADQAGRPLADCLDSYFAVGGELVPPAPAATGAGSLLGQLPEVRVTIRGHALADLLAPAYHLFQEQDS